MHAPFGALLQIAKKWEISNNYIEYLKPIFLSIIHQVAIAMQAKAPDLYWYFFLPKGVWVQIPSWASFFFTFCDDFSSNLHYFMILMSLEQFWTISDFLFKYTKDQPIVHEYLCKYTQLCLIVVRTGCQNSVYCHCKTQT